MAKAKKEVAKLPEHSLTAFMRGKARSACIVCQLPAGVRSQLGPPAAKKGYSRQDQLDWLRTVCGASRVTLDMLNQHLNQRHDREEDSHG